MVLVLAKRTMDFTITY